MLKVGALNPSKNKNREKPKVKGKMSLKSGSKTKLGLIAQIYPIRTIIAPT